MSVLGAAMAGTEEITTAAIKALLVALIQFTRVLCVVILVSIDSGVS